MKMDGETFKLYPNGEKKEIFDETETETSDEEWDFADNRVVCDSRNNCMLADNLFIN